MVTQHILPATLPMLLAVEKAGEAVLEQLDAKQRFFVIMTLLVIVLTGLFLVIFVMVGGHWVRRIARHGPRKTFAVNGKPIDDQLRQSLESVLPEAKTDDTVQLGHAPSDTKVGT